MIRISQRFPTPISTVRKLVLRTVTCALVQTLAIVLAAGHRGASTEADLVLDAIYERFRDATFMGTSSGLLGMASK
jgi:hypothetical protein